MTTPPDIPASTSPRWRAAVEVALIFLVFFIEGAWPVPDVNEPYYLGKAIHYWNPAWVEGDFFLETADTHRVFNLAFGWLSLALSPPALAWTGRAITWGLLAWAWRRLSVAVVPRPWFAVLTAALFAAGVDRLHMAGEWVIGGVEAKGFAYVFVLLAAESRVRSQWRRVWIWVGLASLFHVLVGGWTGVAMGFAWLIAGKDRPTLRSMAPALAAGIAISLPALVPALRLDAGVTPKVAGYAHEIYFMRIGHHLDLLQFPPAFVARFAVQSLVFAGLAWWLAALKWRPELKGLRDFVTGSLAIAGLGALINLAAPWNRAGAAHLLRFYWYRLSDAMVPLGAALLAAALIDRLLASRARSAKCVLTFAIVLAGLHVGHYAAIRPIPVEPRSHPGPGYMSWRMACDWIAHSGRIPEGAVFITPRYSATFKWYARRAEVANWKEIPQDAASIVQWWARLRDLHGDPTDPSAWRDSLGELDEGQLRALGEKYGADYLITEANPPLKKLKWVYKNQGYRIYRLKD